MKTKFKIGDIVRNETNASEERLSNGNTIAVVVDIYHNERGITVYETEYLSKSDGTQGENEETSENIVYKSSLEEVREGFDFVDDDDELKNRAKEIIELQNYSI